LRWPITVSTFGRQRNWRLIAGVMPAFLAEMKTSTYDWAARCHRGSPCPRGCARERIADQCLHLWDHGWQGCSRCKGHGVDFILVTNLPPLALPMEVARNLGAKLVGPISLALFDLIRLPAHAIDGGGEHHVFALHRSMYHSPVRLDRLETPKI
jgi:hypothetical protein